MGSVEQGEGLCYSHHAMLQPPCCMDSGGQAMWRRGAVGVGAVCCVPCAMCLCHGFLFWVLGHCKYHTHDDSHAPRLTMSLAKAPPQAANAITKKK